MLRFSLLLLGVILASFMPIVYALEPLERVQVTSPRLADFRGGTVSENVIVNQLVIITADITNGQDITQDFVYIVQIKDEQNIIRYLNFFKAEVEPAKTFSPGVSWTPNLSGKYVVEIYVWESFVNPEPLSKFHTLELTAS
ncbi:MAG: hypothetical protein ACE5R3_07900 [Nitrosopumilaceae archaeon]